MKGAISPTTALHFFIPDSRTFLPDLAGKDAVIFTGEEINGYQNSNDFRAHTTLEYSPSTVVLFSLCCVQLEVRCGRQWKHVQAPLEWEQQEGRHIAMQVVHEWQLPCQCCGSCFVLRPHPPCDLVVCACELQVPSKYPVLSTVFIATLGSVRRGI